MSRSKTTEARNDQTEQLAGAVLQLADQVGTLREAVDELRSHFVWAVRNDKFRCAEARPADITPTARSVELDEEQFIAITESLQEGLQDVAGDVAETVRDELRKELAQLRGELDAFSTDITWAVRQVRQATSTPVEPDVTASIQRPPDDGVTPIPTAEPGNDCDKRALQPESSRPVQAQRSFFDS